MRPRRRTAPLVTALTAIAIGAGVPTPPALAGATGPRPDVIALAQRAGPPGVPVAWHPVLARVRGHRASGLPVLAAATPAGYTATELRGYLRLRGSGAGQTVAIVDAFDDPYAAADLNAYSTAFGLPRVCSRGQATGCAGFERVHPFGIGGLDKGWAAEESLDVEMVHAIAPRAAIVLVEARSNAFTAMIRALGYAAGLHPAVISNSWTVSPSEFPTESGYDHYCQLPHGVCTFATGDTGHPGSYPAYSPDVIAVGGTTLSLTSRDTVRSERAWSGGGGGVSRYEPRPAYQRPALNPHAGRGIPDVSFDADPGSGVAIHDSASGGWLEVGGTSVGAPAWAAIVAVADQLRATAGKPPLAAAGFTAQRALYHLTSGLADITHGSNGRCGPVCTAGPGYDFVTGLGSPRPGIDTALATSP